MANKVLRESYYWPTLFADFYKTVMSCHECDIFQGKRKFLPQPFQPISVKAPFQQWGLYFIGEIHLASSTQHNWILKATDYFTKWIEAIPTRQATYLAIIHFLETNILSRFGWPHKIITNNATTLTFKKMVEIFKKYNIKFGHSIAYDMQGNGLA